MSGEIVDPQARPISDDELAPGATFAGAYQIVRAVGRGGIGIVYLAKDLSSGALLALKDTVIRTRSVPLTHVEQLRARQHQLSDRRLVSMRSCGEHESRIWYATDYFEGDSVARLLRATGQPLPLERTLSIVRQLCEALASAHAVGLVHREIKASNVLLLSSGAEIRVLDTGFLGCLIDAVSASGADAREFTKRLISPGLEEPELTEDGPPDPRTDIYGVGALLYLLVVGKKPFSDGQQSRAVILGVRPPKMPSTPRAIEKIVQRAMEPRREDRFQSMNDLLKALSKV